MRNRIFPCICPLDKIRYCVPFGTYYQSFLYFAVTGFSLKKYISQILSSNNDWTESLLWFEFLFKNLMNLPFNKYCMSNGLKYINCMTCQHNTKRVQNYYRMEISLLIRFLRYSLWSRYALKQSPSGPRKPFQRYTLRRSSPGFVWGRVPKMRNQDFQSKSDLLEEGEKPHGERQEVI